MDESTKVFTPLQFDCRKAYQTIYELYSKGVSEPTEYDILYDIYESATIQLPKKNVCNQFFVEFMSPLYLFQIFSIVLWFIDGYFYYSCSVTFFTATILLMSFYEIYTDKSGIDKMNNDECEILVTRQNEDGVQFEKTVHSSTLVPGDIIQIRSNIKMPVDALLLSGSVIVNEGVLTGESVPVIKIELPHSNSDFYDPAKDKKYTIYAGTEVLKTK